MQNIANTRSPPALRDENRSFFITSAVKPDEIEEKITPAAAKRRLAVLQYTCVAFTRVRPGTLPEDAEHIFTGGPI